MKITAYKILKITWMIIGIIITLFTSLLFIKMHTCQTLGVIGAALLFLAGIYALFFYILITIIFIIIKWLIKKLK